MFFDIIIDILGFILMTVFSGAAIVVLSLISTLVYIFVKAFVQSAKDINRIDKENK